MKRRHNLVVMVRDAASSSFDKRGFMEDQLRPRMDWGQATKQFADETGHQTLLCVTCVAEGNVSPPSRIVLLQGTSLCLPHSGLIKIGPVV